MNNKEILYVHIILLTILYQFPDSELNISNDSLQLRVIIIQLYTIV